MLTCLMCDPAGTTPEDIAPGYKSILQCAGCWGITHFTCYIQRHHLTSHEAEQDKRQFQEKPYFCTQCSQ